MHRGGWFAHLRGRARAPLIPLVFNLFLRRAPSYRWFDRNRSPHLRRRGRTCAGPPRACHPSAVEVKIGTRWRFTLPPPRIEVRLPQGLRFTDVRRSTIGDFPLARGGSRAPKSHGCCGLYPPSQFLPSLRLSAAAPLPRANLRCLLDGIPGPKRPFVRSLRRFAQMLQFPKMQASPLLFAAPAGLAPPPFVRAVAYGPYQDRMKEAIHALKYDALRPACSPARPDAGSGNRPTWLPKRRFRDAGGARAAAPQQYAFGSRL
jgi:hypothetical protein